MKLSRLKNLAVDSLIYGISGMFIKLIGFILFPLFARKFNAEIYGVIGVLNALNLVLMTFAGLGMEAAATRWFYEKEDKKYRQEIITTWFLGQVITTFVINLLVFFFVKNWLNNAYLKIADGEWLVTILLVNLFLSIIPTILNCYFILNKKPFGSLLTSSSLVIISGLSSLTFVFYLNWGVFGFYLGQTAGFLAISIGGIIYYFRKINHFRFDIFTWKGMSNYGIKIIPANLSNQFLLFTAILIIQPLTSQASLGYFQVAYTLASSVVLFTGGFSQAFVPYALSVEDQEFSRFSSIVLDLYISLMSFICFGLVIFYRELIELFLSSRYLPSEFTAGILTFGNFIISLNAIGSITLIKRKKIGVYGKVILSFNFLNLLFIGMLTSQFGIEGAAAAFLVSQSLSTITVFYYSQKAFPIPYRFLRNVSTISVFLGGYFLAEMFLFSKPDLIITKLILLLCALVVLYLINLTTIRKGYSIIIERIRVKKQVNPDVLDVHH